MSAESLKFFDSPTTKWRACKIVAKLNEKHLLMANIFKLDEYQTFGLIKMHNMSKSWFANNKFNLLRWNKKDFSWFFKSFQLLEVVSDLRLTIKRGLLCNFAKKLKGPPFYGTKQHWPEIFNCYWILNLQNFLCTVFSKICQKYLF